MARRLKEQIEADVLAALVRDMKRAASVEPTPIKINFTCANDADHVHATKEGAAQCMRNARVVAALEAGIPAPDSIGSAWIYRYAASRFTPAVYGNGMSDEQNAKLHLWLCGPCTEGRLWPTLTDAVLAAAEAAGLEV
jgi:hypothetical protein